MLAIELTPFFTKFNTLCFRTCEDYSTQQPQFARLTDANNLSEAASSVALLLDNFSNPSLSAALGQPKLTIPQSLSALTSAVSKLANVLAPPPEIGNLLIELSCHSPIQLTLQPKLHLQACLTLLPPPEYQLKQTTTLPF